MVIVQVIGGTASQMSAFSRGYVVAQRLNTELILDVSDYINGYKFSYALDYFDLNYRKLKYVHATPYVLSEKVLPVEFIEEYHPYVINTNGMTLEEICEEALLHKDENIYMAGEGPSGAKYIKNINEICKIKTENPFLSYFKEKIKDVVSVAVHIRRTDFVALGWKTEYAYYEAGIQYIEERFPNAVFFFFSDDIEDVQNHLGMQDRYRYMRLPGGFATDVVELLCMSLCDHRIMTKNSGYSQWAKALNTNPDAINIIFSEEAAEGCVSLGEEDVNRYAQQYEGKRKVLRTVDWQTDAAYIEANIQTGNIEQAMQRLCEVGFDSGVLGKNQLNDLYSYYENILFMKQNYIEAEQALLGHMEFGLDFDDMYYNMAIVKRMLGKTMASYLFASKLCRESTNRQFVKDFVEIFHGDEEYELFKQLCTTSKMHFIICPNSRVCFYKKYSTSMAIILKQLGHEVSLINPVALNITGNNITEKIVADICIQRGSEIDSSYKNHVKAYPYANYPGGNGYSAVIDGLVEKVGLPAVIIGREIQCLNSAEKYPVLFWDYSEEKDDASQIVKIAYSNWQDYAYAMQEKSSVVITTDITKGVGDKVHVLPSYICKKAYEIDCEKLFAANHIDDEAFLRFVFKVLHIAAQQI